MKACQIYKTKKFYKIATLYKRETGSYIISNPITILLNDIDTESLCKSIFQSLEASRLISEKEENLFYINLLKELKEKSYNNLYKNSISCSIYLEKNIIEIEPNRYLGKNEGLEAVPEKIFKMNYVKGEELKVAKKVNELLNDLEL